MALSWNLDISDSIEFDEFVEYFQAKGVRLFEADLDQSALTMRKLSNNRHFVAERLNRELAQVANLKSFQPTNTYTPQIFLLHVGEEMYVRLCIWNPTTEGLDGQFFAYEAAHDHNFEFLTVGYLGSGYRTQIYEYDHARVIGYEGESVTLRFLEDTRLPFGKVMFFRGNVDVHAQLPPDEQSISINVIKRNGFSRDQYSFDLERQRVLRKANSHALSTLIGFASAVGDANTVDLLSQLAAKNECRRTRLAAYEAVAAHLGCTVWEQAACDPSELVREVARRRLGAAGKLA